MTLDTRQSNGPVPPAHNSKALSMQRPAGNPFPLHQMKHHQKTGKIPGRSSSGRCGGNPFRPRNSSDRRHLYSPHARRYSGEPQAGSRGYLLAWIFALFLVLPMAPFITQFMDVVIWTWLGVVLGLSVAVLGLWGRDIFTNQ